MTSTRRTEPTSFINVDLELFSEFEISELVNHLSSELCLLHHDLIGGLHHACFEVRPSTPKDGPDEFIATFHKSISSLSSALRSNWDNCSRRVIDFGFQSGWKPNIYTLPLTSASIKHLAELQSEFLITIYGTATASKASRRT